MIGRKKIGFVQVGVALAVTHYGLGFLIGTGQDVFKFGPSGILYALSTAVGLLLLIPISKFYWVNKFPIWDLFAQQYDSRSGKITAFLSSFWMVGVVASQILGGSAAMTALGLPKMISAIMIALLILVLSFLNLSKLSKVFFYFLIISSIVVISGLFNFGLRSIFTLPWDFISDILTENPTNIFGVLVSTILITFIGMDFHQFIVDASTPDEAVKGSLLGFVILLTLSIVLGASILGFLSSIGLEIFAQDGAKIVPLMLIESGRRWFGNLGAVLFLVPVIFVSAGSGSAVTKVISRASIELLPKFSRAKVINVVVVLIAFLMTLLSRSIINLVVSFYATYVGAVFIPFLFFLLAKKTKIVSTNTAFFHSILGGFIASLTMLVLQNFNVFSTVNIAYWMLIAGFLCSSIILSINTIIYSWRS